MTAINDESISLDLFNVDLVRDISNLKLGSEDQKC